MNKKVWLILGGLLLLGVLAMNMPNMGGNAIQKTLESHDVWEITMKSDDSSDDKGYFKAEKDRVWMNQTYKDVKYKEDDGAALTIQYVDNETFDLMGSDKDSRNSTYTGGLRLKIDNMSKNEIQATVVDYQGSKLDMTVELRPYTGNGEEDESRESERRESERRESERNDYSSSYSDDDDY